jgi:cell division protein FtsB
VLVFFAILFSYVSPVVNFFDAWRGAHQTDSQLASLRQEESRLEQKASSLKAPNALAEQARRLGMVMDGERSFVVRHLRH